nr:hypothetical protein [Tanacetum cinerariifolium]
MIDNQENVRSRSDKGYHAVPPPYTGNYIPPKPDLMFIDKQVESESVDIVSTVSSSVVKTVESKVDTIDVKNKEFVPKVEIKTVRPSIRKINFVKTARETVEKKEYKEKGVIDSGCSRYMTGNKCYLTDYEDYDGGFVSFGDGKGRIFRKVLLRVPRKDNIYSVDLKSVVPTGGLTCLFAKATIDESKL